MSEYPIEIDVQSVKALQESGEEFFFLDCRGQDEYNTAKIEGAVLIPMQELTGRVEELAGFEDKRVVVHCHLGGRSLRVTHWLRQNGFPNTQNMTGGIEAWSHEIDDSIPRY